MSIDKDLLDRLMEGRSPGDLFGKTGVLAELTKALAERALSTEMEVHLDEERSEEAPEGRNQPANRRNGRSQKTVTTDSGKVVLDIPRDRNGTFDPMLIAKYQRRFPEFDRKIISMYARGMTTREIQGHIEEIYGVEASPSLISAITNAVMEEVTAWQNRPLEPCYPIVFMDAIRVNIRSDGAVSNKAVFVVRISRKLGGDFTPSWAAISRPWAGWSTRCIGSGLTGWVKRFFGAHLSSHAVSGQGEAVGVVDQPVEDGVGQGRVTDGLMPLVDR